MRICLDSNCLRDRTLIEQAINDAQASEGHVLLPDPLLAEMIKSSDWKSTMRSSLKYLNEHPSCIIVADGLGLRMRQERDTGIPCYDLFDEDLTDRFRQFLAEFAKDDSATLDAIEERVLSSQPDVAERLRSAVSLNVNNLGAINQWKEFLTDEALRRMRRGDLTLISEILSSDFMTDVCRLALGSAGYTEDVAKELTDGDSVSWRNFVAHEALLLRWLAKGGLESRKSGQIGNDYMDLEVAVAGTYCNENRAEDSIVQELDGILRPVFYPTDLDS